MNVKINCEIGNVDLATAHTILNFLREFNPSGTICLGFDGNVEPPHTAPLGEGPAPLVALTLPAGVYEVYIKHPVLMTDIRVGTITNEYDRSYRYDLHDVTYMDFNGNPCDIRIGIAEIGSEDAFLITSENSTTFERPDGIMEDSGDYGSTVYVIRKAKVS